MLKGSKYIAKLGGKIVIYETTTGALCAAVPCDVAEGDESGSRVKHTMTIIKSDGTVQDKTVDKLKQVFGWDGRDPFWLAENALDECRFEIVGESGKFINDSNQEVDVWKVKWLNPVGGGAKMPEPGDRKSILAKHGAKLRALAGSAPTSPTKPSAPPATKPTSKPPPNGPVSTEIECWEALGEHNDTLTNDQLSSMWFGLIKQLFGADAKPNTLNQFQWGQLKIKVTDNVAF